MTGIGFNLLPNEMVVQIASSADDSTLLSLLLCNRGLSALLLPVIHIRAFAPRGCRSAIQWAAAHGYTTLAHLLLTHGVHPDNRATETQPPALFEAVSAGNLPLVELLVAHGADVNRTGPVYVSLVHTAAAVGYANIPQLLAAYRADVDKETPSGMYFGTPLHQALWSGHIGAVKALLSFGVKVDKRDSNFESPLEIVERLACNGSVVKGLWESMVEIAELLVEAGAPVR
ncbi:hypothetical protein Q9L58_001493 [Maublancomyces gigas]|uniref:Ankyrin n=1 Tax=Discina gigas TaxID=1032678 RepID=A0ABR3GU63_9PEZI